MINDTVTIAIEEYESLKEAQLELNALEDSGVDNWSGYSDAMSLLEEWKQEGEND